ncbi:glycosyl hydrolase [Clostridium sp. BNL1100]|uniref:glycosyl hydrolase n=1 Tax=Clostridium sp. BNL1100 TaxID=755731 RepID=UPI00024A7882|nr:glycosyl hydrolase [Clostridium sp. BNL1100]AEY67866.1 beta-mannanase [Clostridium sp. BNL1100]
MIRRNFQKLLAFSLSLAIFTTILPFSLSNQVSAANEEQTNVIYENNFEEDSNAVTIGDTKALEYDAVGSPDSDWSTIFQADLGFTYTDKVYEGAVMSFDLLLPEGSTYNGLLKAQAVTKMGSSWTWTQSPVISEIGINEFSDSGKGYMTAHVSIPFGSEIEAVQEIKSIVPCLAGSRIDYTGKIYLDNVKLVNGTPSTQTGSEIYTNDFENDETAVSVGDTKALEYDAVGNPESDWTTVFQTDLGFNYNDNVYEGATMSFDLLLPEGSTYNGLLKAQAVTKMGSSWTWTQSPNIADIGINQFKNSGKGYLTAHVSIPFGSEIEAVQGIKSIVPCLAGSRCDYTGKIYLDNVKMINGISNEEEPEPEIPQVDPVTYTFDNAKDVDGWSTIDGYEYSGGVKISHNTSVGNGSMQLDLDYSQNSSSGWSEAKVLYSFGAAKELNGYNNFKFDFIYNPQNMTSGSFKAKLSAGIIQANTDISLSKAEDYGNGLKKVTAEIEFASTKNSVDNFILGIVGSSTNYVGPMYIDNITFSQKSQENIYVNATLKPEAQEAISVSEDSITANGSTVTTPEQVKMVDDEAIPAAVKLYAYLEAVGKSDSVLFGHQNDTHHKAGNPAYSNSDTKDVTGSISAVVGVDTLSITGNELGTWNQPLSQRVAACAEMTEAAAGQGAIITLSAHMPNFDVIDQRVENNVPGSTDQNKVGILSDGTYNFSGYTPNTTTGDVVTRIMPGQDLNYLYNAYLDMIAEYAKSLEQKNISVLFRPFHECTGSWFWWGAAFCDQEAYKNLYKYTVEYLRDTKGVHNFIYVYGPSSDAESVADYGKRYPGDEYVDMVGFDMYHQNPVEGDNFINQLKTELSIVEQFAKEHGKLFAVTETGVANANNQALLKSGNQRKDWYNEILDAVSPTDASYFLLWANFGTDSGFYTPYVTKKTETTMTGHEMLDNFIDFYNDPRTVFADGMGQYTGISVTAAKNTEVSGYITSPVSGSRILTGQRIIASVTNANDNMAVKFILKNKAGAVVAQIPALQGDGKEYVGVLTDSKLQSIGKTVGTITLAVDTKECNTVNVKFNMPVPVVDPTVVDTFEDYYGDNDVLNTSWSVGKGTGCTVTPSLTNSCHEGEYGLEFKYSLVPGGYVGVTKNLGFDWSDKNTLQLWMLPDGNNQKTVVQVTSGGNVFEVYLNEYAGFKNLKEPVLVTIPFSSFVGRDNKDAKFDPSQIDSFGLWLNTIVPEGQNPDTYKLNSVLYYDSIKAVNTDFTTVNFKVDNDYSMRQLINRIWKIRDRLPQWLVDYLFPQN